MGNPANTRFTFNRGAMPAVLILVILMVTTLGLSAQSDSAELKSSNWNTNPAHWERMLDQHKASTALQIGRSDFTLSGPLVDGVRRSRTTDERSLGKRLLGLPVVRLFVPLPMPSPPGGGRYLLWGESDRPWTSVAQGVPARDPAVTHEARALISVSR